MKEINNLKEKTKNTKIQNKKKDELRLSYGRVSSAKQVRD
jgi:hypothetical protein